MNQYFIYFLIILFAHGLIPWSQSLKWFSHSNRRRCEGEQLWLNVFHLISRVAVQFSGESLANVWNVKSKENVKKAQFYRPLRSELGFVRRWRRGTRAESFLLFATSMTGELTHDFRSLSNLGAVGWMSDENKCSHITGKSKKMLTAETEHVANMLHVTCYMFATAQFISTIFKAFPYLTLPLF